MSSPTTDLVLVRHGLTDWNEEGRLLGRTQVGLNARGRAQAEAVAAALSSHAIGAVLAGPLRRAQETAAPIAAAHGLSVRTEDGLDEVWLRRWVGKTFAEIRDDPDIQRYFVDPLHMSDAFEPATAVRERTVTLVERLHDEHAGERIVLVSHGDPLRVLLSHCLAMPLAEYRRLRVTNGSISVLRHDGRRWQLLALNWRPDCLGL
jgi:broad specificity phosphatase PhoE